MDEEKSEVLPIGEAVSSTQEQRCVFGCLGHSVPKALLFLYFGSLGSKAPSCGSR